MAQRFKAHLANYTDITVSIDGVFFEDGTFVGPDTTNFFAQGQAVVAAKRDLLQQISDQLQRKKQPMEIYKTLEEVAARAAPTLDANSTHDDYYDQFKKMYADEILRMRATQGDEKALKSATKPLGLRWLNLKKQN